jgi:hypothetical protein
MCCLPSDLEDLDFLDLEIPRTCENERAESGVVGVSVAKGSATAGVCVAVIENSNVIPKEWTRFGITPDCPLLGFGLQRKSPRRDVVRILQREKKTLLTVIRLVKWACGGKERQFSLW